MKILLKMATFHTRIIIVIVVVVIIIIVIAIVIAITIVIAIINLINQLLEPVITPLSDTYVYPQLTLRPEADCKRYETLCAAGEVAA